MPTPEWSRDALTWLARALDADPGELHLTRLPGATSSSVFRVDVAAASFVLRVLDNAKWLVLEPDLAEHEAAALAEARRAGLLAPAPLAHSTSDVGFGAPVVIMTFLSGAMNITPADWQGWLRALAAELALIHQHRAPTFPWRYKSWVEHAALAVPGWTASPQVWTRAFAISRGPLPPYKPVFLHRDYHPLNVLWQGERISGVVDWINACQGPAGVDVAHCRTDLALMYGVAAADEFLDLYSRAAPSFEYHPYWDVDSVLDMSFPRPTWYSAWGELGLSPLAPGELEARLDAYLSAVLARF